MKKSILSLIVLIFLTSFLSCKKESKACNLIAAKIIRLDCDRVIFQLLTTDRIGDADWLDVQTGLQYKNVVSYFNTCTINDLVKAKIDDTLFVNIKKINEIPANSFCFQCLMASPNPPLTKVDFIEISKFQCKN